MHYTSGTTGRPKGVSRALSGLTPEDAADLGAELPQLEQLYLTAAPPGQAWSLATSLRTSSSRAVAGGSGGSP